MGAVWLDWLNDKAPVIFVLGIWIYLAELRVVNERKRAERAESRNRELSDSIVSQSTLWQHLAQEIGKYGESKADEIHKTILEAIVKIGELRDIVLRR